jgi:hypothetical protein
VRGTLEMNFVQTLIVALAVVFLSVMDAYPCSLTHDVSSTEMVKNADAIVRATAVEYVKPPRRFFPVWTSGEPDTTVRFKVLEVVRGTMPSELILPGYLGDSDDFNDHVPPYRFVRPGWPARELLREHVSCGRTISVDTPEESFRRIYCVLVRSGTGQRTTSLKQRSLAPLGSRTS